MMRGRRAWRGQMTLQKDERGRITHVPPGSVTHKGHSVCQDCGKDMPGVWDVVCADCLGTFCRGCVVIVGGKYRCREDAKAHC